MLVITGLHDNVILFAASNMTVLQLQVVMLCSTGSREDIDSLLTSEEAASSGHVVPTKQELGFRLMVRLCVGMFLLERPCVETLHPDHSALPCIIDQRMSFRSPPKYGVAEKG